MIYRIFSDLPSFKTLEFRPGLNVLLAQKEPGASDRQTRNRAGKSSLIEIIHFLTGAKLEKQSPFRAPALADASFGMTFDLAGRPITVRRFCAQPNKIHVTDGSSPGDEQVITVAAWLTQLSTEMFGFAPPAGTDATGRTPTFRSLFPYFARRQSSQGFTTPEKHTAAQTPADYQIALLFLLGLDWKIASDWQLVRDREKTLAELKKAATAGTLPTLLGKASDLRTQVTVADAELQQMLAHLASFKVLPEYAELQRTADRLTRSINELSNANVIDLAAIRELENALQFEAPPPLDQLAQVYAEAGVVLPGLAVKRYDEVRSFHQSVIRNRRDYLQEELDTARLRVRTRELQKQEHINRRAEIMQTLNTHGALEQFTKLQTVAAKKQADVQTLRQRFEAAEQLEGTKNQLQIERQQLTLRLRRDFSEQQPRLAAAILAFEETSSRLYESAGSMTVEETDNGPVFQFPMQGARSKGIKNMQIFCFDMMLMRLSAARQIGPGLVVHDSHLFDGVDGRQLISALKVAEETATELQGQYIVTLNEDDATKERRPDFDVHDYLLPVVLTDATEDGGLFGVRF